MGTSRSQHEPGTPYEPPPNPNELPTNDLFAQGVIDLYKKYGRTPTPQEIDSHRGNPGGLAAIDALLKRDSAGGGGGGNADSGGAFGDSWLGSPGMNVTDLRGYADTWNQSHPNDRVEVFGSKGDKVRYRGRVYDAVISAGVNGGTGKSWNDITDGDGRSAGGGSNFNSPGNDELWRFLMDRIHQGLDVKSSDPLIRNQTDAYSAEQERARNLYLKNASERIGPYGTGALQGQERMTAETLGQNVGSFQAQLMWQELTARRNEIQQALSGALGLLSAQQQMSLQRELALLNNAINWANINQHAYEYDQDDEFRRSPLAS